MKAKSCVLLILLALSIECFLLGRAHGQSTETPSPVNPTLTCAPAPCVLPLPLLPTGFTYNGNSVVINADKQSNIYVTNQNHLGGYNASGGNNIETVLTPCDIGAHGGACLPVPPSQGYWSSPAYWFDGSVYWLYYSATMQGSALPCPPPNNPLCPPGFGPPGVSPEPLNAYQLQPTGTTGPISQTPYANSGTSNGPPSGPYPILFCDYAPTPSVSSNGSTAGSGIVSAIEENQNTDNNPLTQGTNPQDCNGSHFNNNPAALHAFCAAAIPGSGTPCPSAMTELCSSRPGFKNATIHLVHGFPTPTIFQGQVYMGTDVEVNVFGICSTNVNNKGQCVK